MLKIVMFAGSAGVGKDTFGAELKSKLEKSGYRCVHIAFADRLKDICTRYFGWNGQKDEEGRKLLQEMGTEIFRAVDEDYWVNEVKNLIEVFDKNDLFDYVIITDLRYPNELKNLIKEFSNIYVFRIRRNIFESRLSAQTQSHSSETALNDYPIPEVIISGDIEKLPQEVGDFIINWRI